MGENTFEIPLAGTPEGVVFDIEGGASVGLTNKFGVTKIPVYTALIGVADIKITPRANGCEGTPVYYRVTVNPRPNIKLSKSAETICSGENANVTFSSTTPNVSNVSYAWTVFAIEGTITGAIDGTGAELNQTLYNNTPNTGSVTYQITVSTVSCEGATINYKVTVHPSVTATIEGGTAICQNGGSPEITFTANGGTPPYTFTYTVNGGANQYITTTSGNSVSLPVLTDDDGDFKYDLISVKGVAGCEFPQTGTTTITVKPLPILTSTLTPTGICSGELFDYQHASSLANTFFSWVRTAVSGISNPEENGTGFPSETLVNTTTQPIEVTYYYTLTANGCTNTQEVKVMVTQSPVLTSNATPNSICSGNIFSYTPTSNINPGTGFSWYRDADSHGNSANSGIGNPNEVLVNNSPNPVTVTYHYSLSSNGCTNPYDFLVTVTVVPAPNVTANASDNSICPNNSINLSSSANLPTGLSTILLSENFNEPIDDWTIISKGDDAEWTLRPNGYTYNGNVFHSNDNSQFILSNNLPDGADTNPQLITPEFSTVGYTSVSLTFWHHYRDGNKSKAVVRWSPTGNNNWTTLEVYNNSNIGETDGFVQSTVSIPVGKPNVYIRFNHNANDDYWWAIDNVEITGVPQATANVLWTSNTSSWTSTEANPTDVYPDETTIYTATYTDPETGCSGSASTTVTVYPQPTPIINADYCVVSPKIRLTASSGYNSYNWQPLPFGETNGRNYIDIDIAGTYTVNVIDANGCPGANTINVSNEYVTNGDFELGNVGFTTPAAANGNQYTYVVDNPSVNNELYPEGLYGVGTNGRNYHSNFWGVDHTTGNGNFMIVNGFPGAPQPIVWQQEITNIEPNTTYYLSAWAISLNSAGNDAQLRFSINGQQIGTTADLTQIPGVNNDSNPWRDEGRFWATWYSGSATSATLAIVDLQTAAGGNDFGIDDISFGILDPSPAEFDLLGTQKEVCSGGTIELFANVTDGKEPITFSWVGPNGHTSNDENPVFENVDETYDGTYTLTVTDWYGCDIPPKSVDIQVFQQAVVDAGADQDFACSADISFQLNGSISGAAQSGTWSTNGSGTFDDETKLDAIYTASTDDIATGAVILTLTSDDPDGPCPAASDDMLITINPSPQVSVEVSNPECYGYTSGSALATISSGTPDYTYLWSDGQTTAEATNLSVGSYSVTITDAKGCTATETVEIEEPSPLVVYPASFTPPTCYGGSDGTATIVAEGGTPVDIINGIPQYVYTWGPATGNQTTQVATGLTVGIYQFTVTDANGCNITSDFVLVTQPEPPTLTCPPNPDPVRAEAGEVVAEVNTEDPIYDPDCQDISWTMSGATEVTTSTSGIVPSPYTYNAGTTTITYTTIDVANQILICSFEVEVIPNDPPEIACIDPDPIVAETDQCSAELNIDLPTINAGSNIAWEWEMTGATEDSGTGEISPNPYTFNVGETQIKWTATNLAGTATCTQTITVTDNQPPTFTAAPFEDCVENLFHAIYTGDDDNLDYGPDYPNADYYLFYISNPKLDINLSTYSDNCCDENDDYTIRWEIDFDGDDPSEPNISGTGQPSTYKDLVTDSPLEIYLWGDGVNFQPRVHKITYWIKDCNDQESDPVETTITVNPRPKIEKVP